MSRTVNTSRPPRVPAAVLSAPGEDPATESLAARAYREIRDRLVMLDIRPGHPINEDQLAAVLGMGRTPVREALKRLTHERLVVSYPRRGTFATDVNITDLAHISEVRLHLEPLAAASAAARATADERATFRELAASLRSEAMAGLDAGALMRVDLQTHRAVYAATHNPFLEDTLVNYDNLANRIWCLFMHQLPGMAGHVSEHGPLLEAVAAGDAVTASELARSHVVRFEEEIRAHL